MVCDHQPALQFYALSRYIYTMSGNLLLPWFQLPNLLQLLLTHRMPGFAPSPHAGLYNPDFIAANQEDRANNVIPGTPTEQLAVLRQQMRDFKATSGVDSVVVLWTANTERYSEVVTGLNDTAENLLAAVARGEKEISPSTLYAIACIQEGIPFINGSPQNTFVPGAIEMAIAANCLIAGDDFKSGQTKLKSVLVDYLVGAGIKPVSIVSYNHLGNNDGMNLSAPQVGGQGVDMGFLKVQMERVKRMWCCCVRLLVPDQTHVSLAPCVVLCSTSAWLMELLERAFFETVSPFL